MGSEEVTDYKIVKNAGFEAVTTIFILLSKGNLVKRIRTSEGKGSLLRDLTQF